MTLSTVTVTWDEQDIGQAPLGGNITFALNEPVADITGGVDIRPVPKTYFFTSATGTSDPLVANDSSVQPAGSHYTITVAITGQAAYSFASQINHANGATQTLAYLQANAAVPAAQYQSYLPLPSGQPTAGQVPVVQEDGSTQTAWGGGIGSAAPITTPTAPVAGQKNRYAAARTVTDGVLNTTTTITSATAAFTSADTGKYVRGTGIPAGVTMTYVSATSATLSVAATATATGVALTIEGNLAVTLPAISSLSLTGSGPWPAEYPIEKAGTDASPYTITFTCAGPDTFEGGATTKTLALASEFAVLVVVQIAGTKYWAIKSQGTGRAQLQAPVARAKNSITIIGDSISNNSGILDPVAGNTVSQQFLSKGWAPQANCLSGNRYTWVAPGVSGAGSYASGANGIGFCLGGICTDDVINSGFLAGAIASQASVVVVHIGTNNINRSDTAAQVMADLLFIWQSLINAGKMVVATTVLPRDSTVITGSKLTNQLTLNTLIRENAAVTAGVVLCDWYPALLDSSGNPPSGSSASTWFVDGLHPNPAGAGRLASVLAPVLQALVPPQPSYDWLPNSASDVLTPNPFATGNVSGVATSWTVTTVGSPSALTPSMVARSDLIPGQWQQVACTAATADTDGWSITVSDTTSSTWTPGTSVVFAACEIQADGASWDCRTLQLDVVLSGVTQVASANATFSSDRTVLTTTSLPAPTGGMVLVTPRLLIPSSGVTAVRAVLRFYGSGTVRVARLGARIAI